MYCPNCKKEVPNDELERAFEVISVDMTHADETGNAQVRKDMSLPILIHAKCREKVRDEKAIEEIKKIFHGER